MAQDVLQYNMGSSSHVSMKVGNVELDFMLDSGSSLSLIPTKLLYCLERVYHQDVLSTPHVISTVSGYVYLNYTVDLEFVIEGCKFSHKFYVIPNDGLKYVLLGVDFLSSKSVVLDYSTKPYRFRVQEPEPCSYTVAQLFASKAVSVTLSSFRNLCSRAYPKDEWICYPDGWIQDEVVFRNDYFAVTVARRKEDHTKKKFFTGVNPATVPFTSANLMKSQMQHHRRLREDPLPNEAIPYFQRWCDTGKLVQINGFTKHTMDEMIDFHPVVTQWYVVQGSRKARPVFTYSLLNQAERSSKVLMDFEQRKLRDIILYTRLYRRILFTDLRDAYFSIGLYTSNYPLNVVRIIDQFFYFTALSFGPAHAPQALECSMGHLMRKHDTAKTQTDCASDSCAASFMDDVSHMDNVEDDDAPFQSEVEFERITAEHDFHFNISKRQLLNIIPGDVEALGVVYTEYGKFLMFSPKQFIRFRDAYPTQLTKLSYSDSLSILGKLPDLVVSGAWNCLFKHLLQSIVSKEVHKRKVSWSAQVSDSLRRLLKEWHDITVKNGTLKLPRLYNFNKPVVLSADSSKYCCAYVIEQDGVLMEEASTLFPISANNVAIVVKEMKALYLGLASVYELEKCSKHKFDKIVINTDNTVVATILRTRRVSAISKRENCPVLWKYLMLLQELFPVGEWTRFDVHLVGTNENRADHLTRHPFLNKLLLYRDKLGEETVYDSGLGYTYLVQVQGHCCSTCCSTIPTKLDIPKEDIIHAQDQDPDIQVVKDALQNGTLIPRNNRVLTFFSRIVHELRLQQGVLCWWRSTAGPGDPLRVPILPESMIEQSIKKAHALGHTDAEQTVEVLKSVCFFPYMWKRTYDEIGRCYRCYLNKKPQPVLPMRQIVKAFHPWQVLHMDIVSYGSLHMLTLIDSFSKYLCWEALQDMTSACIARALQSSIAKLGAPNTIIVDNASNMSGPAVCGLLDSYGTKLEKATEYYPRGNSIVERVHRTLHGLARTFDLKTPADIRHEFRRLVYVYNCKPHRALGNRSPFQVLFGRRPYANTDTQRSYDLENLYQIWDEVRLVQSEQHRVNKIYYDARHSAQERDLNKYQEGQWVLLFTKRKTTMGLPHKLGDLWEEGWIILRGPTNRYPVTALVGRNGQTKVINLRYLRPDERDRSHISEDIKSDKSRLTRSNNSHNVEFEIVDPREIIDIQGHLQVDEDGLVHTPTFLPRKGIRSRKQVRRLTFGLSNAQSYDVK